MENKPAAQLKAGHSLARYLQLCDEIFALVFSQRYEEANRAAHQMAEEFPFKMIRREPKASNGWNGGDIDTARQLFDKAVWDGDLCSKNSRDHLVRNGFAFRSDGFQMLTEKGRKAFSDWEVAHRRRRR